MSAMLDGELTTLAFLWRIERRDGVAIGFTSHDRDLVVAGFRYRAAPGMVPSAVTRRADLDPGGIDVTGALTADAISAVDLIAGRYDGAAVTLMICDWETPAVPMVLTRGELGAVETAGEAFSAELRGGAALFERPAVEETSPECRAELGDRRCRVDMGGRRVFARVTAVEDEAVLRVDRVEPEDGAWSWGRLRWLDGGNAGLSSVVRLSDGDRVELREPPPVMPAAGTRVELIEGCDKRLETCAGRFANVLNFRGEPHLPGNDLLTRYPGG